MSRPSLWILAVLVLMLPPAFARADAPEEGFDATWRDGRAELAGYRYGIVRYGEPRQGTAVAITVTEPFSASKHVKLDDHRKDPDDVVDVLKLNLVRDFPTGLYDYNTMASVFVRAADFTAVKQTFTSAEWCGHVYEDLVFGPKRVRARVFSYFEDETAEEDLDVPQGGVTEEQLLVVLRGLRGPYLEPGAKREVPFLAGTLRRRLAHRPLAWSSARIQRLQAPETVMVLAGTFATDVYVVHTAAGRKGVFHIERAAPHRIVRWSWDQAKEGGAGPFETAERAELAGSTRLPYWKLNREGHERYLADLGLPAGE